jgi:hypothetical protein
MWIRDPSSFANRYQRSLSFLAPGGNERRIDSARARILSRRSTFYCLKILFLVLNARLNQLIFPASFSGHRPPLRSC